MDKTTPKDTVLEVITLFYVELKNKLDNGESVSIDNFGTFCRCSSNNMISSWSNYEFVGHSTFIAMIKAKFSKKTNNIKHL